MMDARTQKYLDTLDPKAAVIFVPFIVAAKASATAQGVDYVAISGNRTWAEQDALYEIGRSKPGKRVTNARGGQSNHNFGIALDFGCFDGGKYLDGGTPAEQRLAESVHGLAGKIAYKHAIEWGGLWQRFKDFPHFQVATGLSMSTMRSRYAAKRTIFPL